MVYFKFRIRKNCKSAQNLVPAYWASEKKNTLQDSFNIKILFFGSLVSQKRFMVIKLLNFKYI